MSAVRLNAVTFVACSALAVAVAWHAVRRGPPPRPVQLSPLSAVPQGAMLIATLDARKLLSTRLGAALLGGGGELPGLGPIADACGFDPTHALERLAFAVPGSPQKADRDAPAEFGVAGYGDFASANVGACAGALIRRRDGTPVTTRIGSFTSVRRRSDSDGEIAVRDGGPVLLAGGRYLREMIDAADGRLPNATSDPRHRALRQNLGEDATLLATCLLPRDWLMQLADDELVRGSPLASVEQAALRVDVGTRVEATLALSCPTLIACAELTEMLRGLLESGLDPLFEDELAGMKQRLQLVASAEQVRITFWLEEGEAIQLASSAMRRLKSGAP